MDQYDLDGADIDWEYPGTNGASGNIVSSSDTANFLAWLKVLRSVLGDDAHISSCATHHAFIGADGSPLADVSAFAELLDNVFVMNYDVWGSSSTPGPNAPLSDACDGSLQPSANMESAIEAWESAGMPASKILMGIPYYGYISSSWATSLIHKRDNNQVGKRAVSNRERANAAWEDSVKSPLHRWYDAEAPRREAAKRRWEQKVEHEQRLRARSLAQEVTDSQGNKVIICPGDHSGNPCEGVRDQNITDINWNPLSTNGTGTVPLGAWGGQMKVGTGDLSTYSGGNQINFRELINYGVIVQNDDGDFVGDNGYTRAWDSCSSTVRTSCSRPAFQCANLLSTALPL